MQTLTYLEYINKAIAELATTQTPAIDAASTCMVEALAQGNRIFAFGSGHSHMIAKNSMSVLEVLLRLRRYFHRNLCFMVLSEKVLR